MAFGGTDAGSRYRIWLYVEAGEYFVAQQGPNTASSPKTKIPVEVKTGQWTHVTLDVSFASKTITATLGSVMTTVPFVPEAIPGALVFSVGVDYVEGPSERVAVHYDDVLLVSK